jgi:hypothetical protein
MRRFSINDEAVIKIRKCRCMVCRQAFENLMELYELSKEQNYKNPFYITEFNIDKRLEIEKAKESCVGECMQQVLSDVL